MAIQAIKKEIKYPEKELESDPVDGADIQDLIFGYEMRKPRPS